jgi:hypothetical protein
MWWITLAVGVVGVGLGLRQLVLAFVAGAEREGDPAATTPALRFVRSASLVTGGLFLAFLSVANLVAQRSGAG